MKIANDLISQKKIKKEKLIMDLDNGILARILVTNWDEEKNNFQRD